MKFTKCCNIISSIDENNYYQPH
eukprot:UN10489